MSRSTSIVLALALASPVFAQEAPPAPLALLDVPYVVQSEALCGGAAAAMVLRYWGERGIAAESFAALVDQSAAGIRTDALIADLQSRGWRATALAGRDGLVRTEIAGGRPVITLIEDRPGVYHYVVVVAWHERGIIVHDPARGPFQVISTDEFDRRWRAADRWMAVILPPETDDARSVAAAPAPLAPADSCDAAIADGVRAAQAEQLDAAERILASALTCPGGAAHRELAGVRLLQRRWSEVVDLASTAIAAAPDDEQAWRLLATARFVQDDRAGALDAWNQVGEPRLDLLTVQGLTRTRFGVVDRLVGVESGEVLDRGQLLRARRRLEDLPSAARTSMAFVPVGRGLAELRGAVVERPLLPSGRLGLTAVALRAAVSRELRVTTGSLTGGGESISAGWLFWPERDRRALSLNAPSPWGGVWSVEWVDMRQPFTEQLAPAERLVTRLGVAGWVDGRWRLGAAGGLERRGDQLDAVVTGSVLLRSEDDRLSLGTDIESWLGSRSSAVSSFRLAMSSSAARRGIVVQAYAAAQVATSDVAPDLLPAGDTGHVRPTLLRAHPVLDGGALRIERLGRVMASATLEGQRWWPVRGGLAAAAAAFVDVGRTTRRRSGGAVDDVDVGVGGRLVVPGVPGVIRVDVAKGLADGATALSFVLQP